MRNREKELLWELPLALIALGGVAAVIESIPRWVVLALFFAAFLLMLVTWGLRFKDARYPVKIVAASIRIDTLQARILLKQKEKGTLKKSVGTIAIVGNEHETRVVKGENEYPRADPILQIEVTFYSSDMVRISRKVILRLDKPIEDELKALGRLHTQFDLQTDDATPSINIQGGVL